MTTLVQYPQDACPECGSINYFLDIEEKEIVCRNCGYVSSDPVLNNRYLEQRSFNSIERLKHARTSPYNPMAYDFDMGSKIDWEDKDLHGKEIEVSKKSEFSRLRKWEGRIKSGSSKIKSLKRGLKKIDTVTSKLQLPKKIKYQASKIFRKAIDDGFLKGRKVHVVAAASVYTACRESQLYRLGIIDSISETSELPEKDIKRDYRLLVKHIKQWKKMPIDDPIRYISTLRSELNFSKETEDLAIKIIEKAKEKKLTSGHDPRGMAGAAIDIATKFTADKIKQVEIAKKAKVTDVTLRNRKNELVKGNKYTKSKGLMFEIKV